MINNLLLLYKYWMQKDYNKARPVAYTLLRYDGDEEEVE